MLKAFFKPFKDSSVQLEGNVCLSLELILPIKVKQLDFFQICTTDSDDIRV